MYNTSVPRDTFAGIGHNGLANDVQIKSNGYTRNDDSIMRRRYNEILRKRNCKLGAQFKQFCQTKHDSIRDMLK